MKDSPHRSNGPLTSHSLPTPHPLALAPPSPPPPPPPRTHTLLNQSLTHSGPTPAVRPARHRSRPPQLTAGQLRTLKLVTPPAPMPAMLGPPTPGKPRRSATCGLTQVPLTSVGMCCTEVVGMWWSVAGGCDLLAQSLSRGQEQGARTQMFLGWVWLGHIAAPSPARRVQQHVKRGALGHDFHAEVRVIGALHPHRDGTARVDAACRVDVRERHVDRRSHGRRSGRGRGRGRSRSRRRRSRRGLFDVAELTVACPRALAATAQTVRRGRGWRCGVTRARVWAQRKGTWRRTRAGARSSP